MSTRRRTLAYIKIDRTSSANAGLWLDKFITDVEKTDAPSRSNLVSEVSLLSISEAYNTFYERWKNMLSGHDAMMRIATAKGRMVIGLGDESVLETSIMLHHTYGVPYIPGSALKGLAASYVRQKLSDEWHQGSQAYKVVFGDTDDAGFITFFDALYIPGTGYKEKVLYPDIITVHHQDYYNNRQDKAPADWDSPIPIPFLSATGSYLIALAGPELPPKSEWITSAFNILEHALKEMGIGAKTSSGYGRMMLEPDFNGPGMEEARNYHSRFAHFLGQK